MRMGATFMRKGWIAAVALVCAASPSAQTPNDLNGVLTRVGERVEEYYRRAQSMVCLETVRVQSLRHDLTPDDRGRVLKYELRVSWEPAVNANTPPEATVLRQLLTIDGRSPSPDAEPGCMDPRAVSPDPLAMMLAGHREAYAFAWGGPARVRGRRALKLDYKSRTAGKAEIAWRGECFSISLPGRTRGRVWVDQTTNEVLRLDESLTGTFDYQLPQEHTRPGGPLRVEIQRADSSIRYRPVVFHDPEEAVLLPATIESLQIVQGAGAPRVRITQTFSDHRRFITGARIVR